MKVAATSASSTSNKNYLRATKDFVNNYNTKKVLNLGLNGGSSLLSLFSFINSNFHIFDFAKEKLERASEILSKIAIGKTGFLSAADLWQKKNLIPCIGFALEVPIAIFSSGYNLWVSRGISNALAEFALIIDQREVVDRKGEPILDKKGNIQLINGDFEDRGWWNGFTITCKEIPRLMLELIKKPSRIKKLSHSLTLVQLVQMTAPIFGLLGAKMVEASIRNVCAIGTDVSLLLDKNIKSSSKNQVTPQKGINLKSPFVRSGLTWIGTAIIDELKRFDFISDKLNNLTSLSLAFDRGAAANYTHGLLNIKKES